MTDQKTYVPDILQIHLEEFRQCRDEVKTYTGRIDYILIVYISAILGIIVFFFNCEDPVERYNNIRNALAGNTILPLSLLSATYLQALLLLLISNYSMYIYRNAKFTSTYLLMGARLFGHLVVHR
jgi:hypothetical protein